MSVLGWVRSTAVIVLLASMQAGAQSPKSVAFSNVSVVPMDSQRVLADHTVIVTNGRVTAVGPAAATHVPIAILPSEIPASSKALSISLPRMTPELYSS